MKPILFNGEMVRAILDSRKTQTRRINKDGGELSMPDMSLFDAQRRTYGVHHYYDFRDKISTVEAPVPICPGDVLYVRETWGRTFYADASMPEFVYRASDPEWGEHYGWKWRPSIHMPREAARIFLRVTDVRVERLQGINAEGIKAEGITVPQGFSPVTPYSRFADLWDSTIKLAELDHFGWNANPWVWVYTFERITREEAEAALKGADND